jgi:hypothetical protein
MLFCGVDKRFCTYELMLSFGCLEKAYFFITAPYICSAKESEFFIKQKVRIKKKGTVPVIQITA